MSRNGTLQNAEILNAKVFLAGFTKSFAHVSQFNKFGAFDLTALQPTLNKITPKHTRISTTKIG